MDEKSADAESVYSDEGDISFRGMWTFIKKSAMRTLIYLAAALVIVTAVFLGVRFFATGDYSASAKTELSFDEIAQGMNPDGTKFDKDAVKSAANVKAAAASAGLTDMLTAKGYEVSDLRSKIYVEPVVSEQDRDKETAYFPTRYTVSLKDYKDMGMTNLQACAFVDALVFAYGRDFAETYFAAAEFSDASFEPKQGGVYDFIDNCDAFSVEYENIDDYLAEFSGKAPSFRSAESGKSFTSLKNELAALQNSLSSLRFHVVEIGAFDDLDAAKLKMKNKAAELDARQKRLSTIVTEMKEQLRNFQPSTSTVIPSGSDRATMTVVYPQQYVDLQLKLTEYIEQLATTESLKADAAGINERLASVTDVATQEQMEEVRKELDALGKLSKEFVSSLNDLNAEYADARAAKSGVTEIFPAVYERIPVPFPAAMSYLIAIAAAIVLSFAVTAVVSSVKRKKKEKKAVGQERK